MKRIFFILLSLLVALAVVDAPGCRTEKAAESNKVQSLVGTVCVTGNEPFTQLSLQTIDGAMHPIDKDSTKAYANLWKLQGKKVEILYRRLLRKSAKPSLMIERYSVVEDRQ